MEYALKERIGKPELFTGRKEELAYFLSWVQGIEEEMSQSTAILARRKMGKTAIMERLFNIVFHNNGKVVPFYYEVKETKMWVGDFCQDFFLTFIYQYIAFKSRKTDYLYPESRSDFGKAVEIAKREGLDYLCGIIEDTAHALKHEKIDTLWNIVRQVPHTIAHRRDEFVVQMIDEFQFINAMFYRDKEMKLPADTLAGGYLSTAESKIAPLLVSGSWVGWLMEELTMMLPARFKYEYLENMPEDEAVEMVYKYSQFFRVPVSEESAYMIARFSEGSPFYIGCLLRSRSRGKDLTHGHGLVKALEFETLDNRGSIKGTWMEYVDSAFSRINDRNAKNIVLYLCQHRDREVTRKELLDELQLDMSDRELEKRLKALVKADIIQPGQTNFDYRGVTDNIFDKVFRGVYEKEIREFDVKEIGKEYGEAFKRLQKEYRQLPGKLNYHKGTFAEYLIIDRLRLHGREQNAQLKAMTRNLPDDFNFCEYSLVWRYDTSPQYDRSFNIDIFARAKEPGDYSIIGEVKNRDTKKFSKEEAEAFLHKFGQVKELEKIDKALPFVLSRSGFTQEAEDYCRDHGIACSDDEAWLD